MSKVMWMNEYERIEEDLTSGAIEVEEAKNRLSHLGFGRCEVEYHIDAWRESMGDG